MLCAKSDITPDALSFLENYVFPGNVRELKNIIGAIGVCLLGILGMSASIFLSSQIR